MTTSAVAKVSKKNQFIAILATMDRSIGRKALIANLSSAIGISEACASTYLSNVNSGKWTATEAAAEPKVAKVIAPTVEPIVTAANPIVEGESFVTTIVEGVKIHEQDGKTTVDGKSLDDMSGPELVAMFNALPDVTPVTKFRTKAAGIKRIVDQLTA